MLAATVINIINNIKGDQEWWLVPIIPALWEAKAGRRLELRNSRLAWETWQNPVSTKYIKIRGIEACACNPSYSGGWGRRITWIWEVEVSVSQDRAIALQPGQQSKTPSQKTKQNKTKQNKNKNKKQSDCSKTQSWTGHFPNLEHCIPNLPEVSSCFKFLNNFKASG